MKSILKVKGKKDCFLLIISLIFTLGLPAIISIVTRNAPAIYKVLVKPSFSPPPTVFAIVWPILYFMIGLAFYRILMLGKLGYDVNKEIILFVIQFVLNLLWSIIFFYFNLRFLAFIELFILIIFIIFTTIAFYKKDKIAGFLLLPYLIWSSFALILNYQIYKLNK